MKTAARTSIHPSLCLCIEAEPGAPVAVSTGAGHVPTFSGFFGEGTRDERRKSEEGPKGARLAEFPIIRLFETNFLGPQGCLNKKHTCGEPTAGVAHTFPGGIQGPGRGVTAHQRAPPEKATGPARLAHPGFGPGFGLEHPGNGTELNYIIPNGPLLSFSFLTPGPHAGGSWCIVCFGLVAVVCGFWSGLSV